MNPALWWYLAGLLTPLVLCLALMWVAIRRASR